jgi:diguanylate cyclase (GGDEF)-like protein/PAS domain S-box-containing protein
MKKIDRVKNEINKMIDGKSLHDEELVKVSQFLDKILVEHIRTENCEMSKKKADYELEFEEFTDILPCAIYVIRDSIIIDCNMTALKVFGYDKKEEVIGLMPYELSPQYQDDGTLSIIKGQQFIDNAQDDNILCFHWKHKRKNGEVFLSDIKIYNKNNILYAIISDISENSKLKEDLNNKEHLYQMLFENHNSVMLVINPDSGKIVEANHAAIKYYGYTKENILKMYINEINTLSDNEIKNEIALALREKRNFFQFTHQLADNTQREVEVHSFPVVTNAGKLLFSVVTDVDDKMKQKLMFDKLLIASPYAVAILDKEQRIVNINSNFIKLFHYTLADVKGKYINELVSPYDNKVQVDKNIELIYQGKIVKQEGKRMRSDGNLIDVEIIGYPVLYHQSVIGVYILYIDNADKKQYINQLHLFKKILENNTEGVFITDQDGHAKWINNAYTEITGYSLDDLINQKTNLLKPELDDSDFYNEMWNQLVQNGKWKGEIWNKNNNDSIFPAWLSINNIKDDQNNITHYVGVFNDLSEKKKIYKRMMELQQRDSLTGLYNRFYFLTMVDKYIEDYKYNKEKFSIIVIDIEAFKDINDSVGHIIGDTLLKEISNRINDLLTEEHIVSRVDGDEFAILCNTVLKNELKSLTKKLLHKLNQPYNISNFITYLNFNIGICIYPKDGNDSEDLLRYANVAIYESKKKSDNRICFYSNKISQEIEQKFFLANYLFGAITNKELSVYYQPIFDINEKKLVGAEALLRWDSPILGQVSPEEFIPIAEKTGQIIEIGEWVIEEVCKQISTWHRKNYVTIPVSVNVSVKQLEQVNFANTLLSHIESSHIKPESIEIEITESVSSGDIKKIIKNIKILKINGIKISMDDFGTGFSSLGQLNIFQLDKLKIDKIFVNDLVNGLKRQNLVKSIIAMAQSLNLITVAEGIETNEQLYQLEGLGCQLGQGYIFSRPLSVADIEVMLMQIKS